MHDDLAIKANNFLKIKSVNLKEMKWKVKFEEFRLTGEM